jgi:hypothetical protein
LPGVLQGTPALKTDRIKIWPFSDHFVPCLQHNNIKGDKIMNTKKVKKLIIAVICFSVEDSVWYSFVKYSFDETGMTDTVLFSGNTR